MFIPTGTDSIKAPAQRTSAENVAQSILIMPCIPMLFNSAGNQLGLFATTPGMQITRPDDKLQAG